MSDQCAKQLVEHFRGICEHVSTRAGLLHQLLAQKMGLYRHCMAQDLKHYSKVSPPSLHPYCFFSPHAPLQLVTQHCATVQDVVKVIKNVRPSPEV